MRRQPRSLAAAARRGNSIKLFSNVSESPRHSVGSPKQAGITSASSKSALILSAPSRSMRSATSCGLNSTPLKPPIFAAAIAPSIPFALTPIAPGLRALYILLIKFLLIIFVGSIVFIIERGAISSNFPCPLLILAKKDRTSRKYHRKGLTSALTSVILYSYLFLHPCERKRPLASEIPARSPRFPLSHRISNATPMLLQLP